MNQNEILFSQADIASYAEVTPSVVSHHIAKHQIMAIQSGAKSEQRKKYNFQVARTIIKEFQTKDHAPKYKTQVFFNFKGGTGKTSLCHQLSVMFALYGYKILVIDCDPQAHLSYSLGCDEQADNLTLYDVIVNKVSIEEAIIKNVYEGLDLIPANLSLTRLELPLNQMPNREKVLLKLLEKTRDNYDFVFMDTNPTISTLNRNATLAADMLNIVCETQPYSLKGLEILVAEINAFAEVMEKPINYQIIPNKYESKTAISQESLGILHTSYRDNVLESVVRKSEDINLSAKMRKPVFGICNKKSVALEDIKDLGKELMRKSTYKIKGELSDAA